MVAGSGRTANETDRSDAGISATIALADARPDVACDARRIHRLVFLELPRRWPPGLEFPRYRRMRLAAGPIREHKKHQSNKERLMKHLNRHLWFAVAIVSG